MEKLLELANRGISYITDAVEATLGPGIHTVCRAGDRDR